MNNNNGGSNREDNERRTGGDRRKENVPVDVFILSVAVRGVIQGAYQCRGDNVSAWIIGIVLSDNTRILAQPH